MGSPKEIPSTLKEVARSHLSDLFLNHDMPGVIREAAIQRLREVSQDPSLLIESTNDLSRIIPEA